MRYYSKHAERTGSAPARRGGVAGERRHGVHESGVRTRRGAGPDAVPPLRQQAGPDRRRGEPRLHPVHGGRELRRSPRRPARGLGQARAVRAGAPVVLRAALRPRRTGKALCRHRSRARRVAGQVHRGRDDRPAEGARGRRRRTGARRERRRHADPDLAAGTGLPAVRTRSRGRAGRMCCTLPRPTAPRPAPAPRSPCAPWSPTIRPTSRRANGHCSANCWTAWPARAPGVPRTRAPACARPRSGRRRARR